MRRHVLLTIIALVSLVAMSCGGGVEDGQVPATGSMTGPVFAGDYVPGDTIRIVADEFRFSPSIIEAPAGRYTVELVNRGTIEHDIVFADGTRAVAGAGESSAVEVDIPDGGMLFSCEIAGHAEAGMVGEVRSPGGPSLRGDDTVELVAGQTVEPDPDAPPYVLRDPRVPARGEGEGVTLVEGGAPGGGDLIEFEMVIEEKPMTVAEGFVQQVWTFNGTVPGPTIRTHVGDTVRVRLVNPPEAEVSHSIDFHASQVAWNDEMRSIEPGEELIYEFTTDYAGVWMYHCGTPPVLHHIANGMFGAVIVEPEGGLPEIADEFFLIQNEWYLGPQGEVSSLAKADQGAPSPDLMMFNGIANQYLDNPIQIDTNEEIRLYVLNVGPSMDSSFHIVGTIFDTVIREGVQLLRGNDGNWGSQAVDLAPAQGAVIELQAKEDGLYPIVTHAFNFPGRGALGLLQAGDGDPTN